MTNYYFVGAALPEIKLGVTPDISLHDFMILCLMNLKPADLEQVRAIRLLYDIQNLKAYWRKEPLSYRGNYDANELEENILTQTGFPQYVFDFIDRYESNEDKLRNFSSLIASYFNDEIPKATGFLHDYLIFEREWRLVLLGFRAKKLGRDLLTELQYEDPNDDLVAQILAQKDSRTYEPPSGYEDLKPLFDEYCDAPLKLHQALCEYRFQKIDDMAGLEVFSMDRILAFMAKLIIVEKLLELDKIKGIEIVDTIVKDAS